MSKCLQLNNETVTCWYCGATRVAGTAFLQKLTRGRDWRCYERSVKVPMTCIPTSSELKATAEALRASFNETKRGVDGLSASFGLTSTRNEIYRILQGTSIDDALHALARARTTLEGWMQDGRTASNRRNVVGGTPETGRLQITKDLPRSDTDTIKGGTPAAKSLTVSILRLVDGMPLQRSIVSVESVSEMVRAAGAAAWEATLPNAILTLQEPDGACPVPHMPRPDPLPGQSTSADKSVAASPRTTEPASESAPHVRTTVPQPSSCSSPSGDVVGLSEKVTPPHVRDLVLTTLDEMAKRRWTSVEMRRFVDDFNLITRCAEIVASRCHEEER